MESLIHTWSRDRRHYHFTTTLSGAGKTNIGLGALDSLQIAGLQTVTRWQPPFEKMQTGNLTKLFLVQLHWWENPVPVICAKVSYLRQMRVEHHHILGRKKQPVDSKEHHMISLHDTVWQVCSNLAERQSCTWLYVEHSTMTRARAPAAPGRNTEHRRSASLELNPSTRDGCQTSLDNKTWCHPPLLTLHGAKYIVGTRSAKLLTLTTVVASPQAAARSTAWTWTSFLNSCHTAFATPVLHLPTHELQCWWMSPHSFTS